MTAHSDVVERLEATVRGRVQGVGFRWFVALEAQRLALGGWVRNAADGSVQVVAEGTRADLERLAERLAIGPTDAHVIDLSLRWLPAAGAPTPFEIRSGGHPGD